MEAVEARFERQRLQDARTREALAKVSFQPDFSSFSPLVKKLGLESRTAAALRAVEIERVRHDPAVILPTS